MYAYYIGENTDWINRISHCLECQVITFNNPIKTILCINEQSKKDISPTYIFIESYNKKRDLQWLEAIEQSNLKNTYLLLLSEKVSKEDIIKMCATQEPEKEENKNMAQKNLLLLKHKKADRIFNDQLFTV